MHTHMYTVYYRSKETFFRNFGSLVGIGSGHLTRCQARLRVSQIQVLEPFFGHVKSFDRATVCYLQCHPHLVDMKPTPMP